MSPYRDCHGENDVPMVPNVGMFASFDPVAIDVACADAVNAMPVYIGSALYEAQGRATATRTTLAPSTRRPTGRAAWSTPRRSVLASRRTP